jgi:hypothetical protein
MIFTYSPKIKMFTQGIREKIFKGKGSEPGTEGGV